MADKHIITEIAEILAEERRNQVELLEVLERAGRWLALPSTRHHDYCAAEEEDGSGCACGLTSLIDDTRVLIARVKEEAHG